MRSAARAPLVLVLAVGLLVACSPLIRVRARVERVDGVAVDVSKVAVRVRALCHGTAGILLAPDAGPPEPPTPFDPDAAAAARDASVPFSPIQTVFAPQIRVEDGVIAFDVHGVSCDVTTTAWLDANGDGVVGAGDYVGSLGPVQVQDRGLCAGNLNEIGPYRLSAVVP